MTTSSTERTAPRKARRWVGVLLAIVLLPAGAALLIYSYNSFRAETGDANPAPQSTPSPTVITSTLPVAAPTPSPGASAPSAPRPSVTTVTSIVEVPVAAPPSAPQGSDPLTLITTISGLLASIAGIVSAIVSARTARRSS